MRAPAPVATGANLVALGTLALATAGFLGRRLDLVDPLLAQGMLVVALGGTILGITVAAVGLMVTRHRRDPVGRRRAWVGAGLSIALLVALIVDLQRKLGFPAS